MYVIVVAVLCLLTLFLYYLVVRYKPSMFRLFFKDGKLLFNFWFFLFFSIYMMLLVYCGNQIMKLFEK